MWAKEALGISYDRVQYDFAGLNHLNFMSNITIDGRAVTEEEFEAIAKRNVNVDLDLIKLLGVIPSLICNGITKRMKRYKRLQTAVLPGVKR